MLERLMVDGLIYEVRTDIHNCIHVALVGGGNRTLQVVQYDPFDRYEEWAREPYRMDDINGVRKPVLVQRCVLKCIRAWLNKERPYYFRYQISSPRRLRLYARTAARLAADHHYTVHYSDDGSFHFYRNKEAELP